MQASNSGFPGVGLRSRAMGIDVECALSDDGLCGDREPESMGEAR